MRRNTKKLLKLVTTALLVVLCTSLLFRTFVSYQMLDYVPGGSFLPRAPRDAANDVAAPRVFSKPAAATGDKASELKAVAKPSSDAGGSTEKDRDWHNYPQMQKEASAKGPGEQGLAFFLPAGLEQKKEQLYKVNGFNALASDFISLNRSLPDIRHPGCRKKRYVKELPTASVVVPFHNEHWTTLLRTATSVLNRSPPGLIKEIILADDFSNKDQLKKPLEDYIAKHFTNVHVVRATKREGLIRARLMGARQATGDVLIFLDSHTEANTNWLPPLLEPIAKDYRTVVCPFIDVIDYETFAYRAQDEGARGSFDWELYYKRLPLLPDDLAKPTEPFKSPVMAGGLFAISRKYFWELGGYDEGLDVWGGEQYELSFKIWQCGGTMVDAPCSRVGHIYRKFAPFPNPGIGDFVGRNYRRVAEVWMDEYKEHLYHRRPHYRHLDPGDLTAQKALRKRLNCKSFKWFMEQVAFDQPSKYPAVEPPDYAWGEVRNEESGLCIDTQFKGQNERFSLAPCLKDQRGRSGEQQLVLTWHKDVRPAKRSVCFDVSSSDVHAPVMLWSCHGMHGNQLWKYDTVTKHLFHPITANCLDCDAKSHEVFMSICDSDVRTQRWLFEHVNETALANW
ncbi:polypeptide N-acetylgalactosaminyltransferase 10 isoform X1 [Ixodes scapularis]|uniref:polypeptide N-acetylgalactosaminyltransferase 10 isoform X1 n=1 Tax=Ixodes scapularis TaxID=6945 RepID=UPI001A9EC786|nr:polypeptide N-acetylgalactosaminyltransferase 10 isoform X1 [Ixodes scapularis]